MSESGGAVPIALPAASGAFGPAETDQFIRVLGAAGAETGGTNPVTYIIRGTASASGPVICVLSMAASGADKDWKGPQPVRAKGQLYAQKIGTGTIAGSVFLA